MQKPPPVVSRKRSNSGVFGQPRANELARQFGLITSSAGVWAAPTYRIEKY